MSIPPNQFRRDHPWTRFVLLSFWTNLSTCPAKQSNSSSVEVSVLLHVLDLFFLFLRITLMSGLLLLVTARALLMSPKGRNASRYGLV